MTILGPDISSYQQGVNVATLKDPFVLLKCTEGTYYADPDYAGWLAQAKASGKLVIAYHFVRADETPSAQAQWLRQHIIDTSLPVMLDIETEGNSNPSVALVAQVADAIHAVGLRVKLAYLPHWYWANIGSPSLAPLATRGIGLVSSAYPSHGGQEPAGGYAASGGDQGAGWGSYGGVSPVLWQYTDSGVEQQQLDFNAFRGTIDQLATFLGAPAPSSSTQQGGAMPNIPASIGQFWPEIAGQFPANQDFDTDTALIWSDAGARAAALYAKQARDAANAVAAKVSGQSIDVNALAAQLGPLLRPSIDVNALAGQIVTAISGHLSDSVDAQAVAVAVQAQLASALGAHGAG